MEKKQYLVENMTEEQTRRIVSQLNKGAVVSLLWVIDELTCQLPIALPENERLIGDLTEVIDSINVIIREIFNGEYTLFTVREETVEEPDDSDTDCKDEVQQPVNTVLSNDEIISLIRLAMMRGMYLTCGTKDLSPEQEEEMQKTIDRLATDKAFFDEFVNKKEEGE